VYRLSAKDTQGTAKQGLSSCHQQPPLLPAQVKALFCRLLSFKGTQAWDFWNLFFSLKLNPYRPVGSMRKILSIFSDLGRNFDLQKFLPYRPESRFWWELAIFSPARFILVLLDCFLVCFLNSSVLYSQNHPFLTFLNHSSSNSKLVASYSKSELLSTFRQPYSARS